MSLVGKMSVVGSVEHKGELGAVASDELLKPLQEIEKSLNPTEEKDAIRYRELAESYWKLSKPRPDLYEIAIRKGRDLLAMRGLGYFYLHGHGVKKDHDRAEELLVSSVDAVRELNEQQLVEKYSNHRALKIFALQLFANLNAAFVALMAKDCHFPDDDIYIWGDIERRKFYIGKVKYDAADLAASKYVYGKVGKTYQEDFQNSKSMAEKIFAFQKAEETIYQITAQLVAKAVVLFNEEIFKLAQKTEIHEFANKIASDLLKMIQSLNEDADIANFFPDMKDKKSKSDICEQYLQQAKTAWENGKYQGSYKIFKQIKTFFISALSEPILNEEKINLINIVFNAALLLLKLRCQRSCPDENIRTDRYFVLTRELCELAATHGNSQAKTNLQKLRDRMCGIADESIQFQEEKNPDSGEIVPDLPYEATQKSREERNKRAMDGVTGKCLASDSPLMQALKSPVLVPKTVTTVVPAIPAMRLNS